MRISDWSSDVCSSDLAPEQQCLRRRGRQQAEDGGDALWPAVAMPRQRIARDHPRQQEKGVNGEQDPGVAEETWNMAKGSQSTQSSLLFAVSAVRRLDCVDCEDRKSTRLNSSH